MSKIHAPGPWKAEKPTWLDSPVIVGGDGVLVAKMIDRQTAVNDARLVAAAPELLGALRMCLDFIEHKLANEGKVTTDAEWDVNVAQFRTSGPISIGIGRSYTDKAYVNLGAVRAAIAAATGEAV